MLPNRPTTTPQEPKSNENENVPDQMQDEEKMDRARKADHTRKVAK